MKPASPDFFSNTMASVGRGYIGDKHYVASCGVTCFGIDDSAGFCYRFAVAFSVWASLILHWESRKNRKLAIAGYQQGIVLDFAARILFQLPLYC